MPDHRQKAALPFPSDNFTSERFRDTHLPDDPPIFSGFQVIEQDEPFILNHTRIKVMLISMYGLLLFFRRIKNPSTLENAQRVHSLQPAAGLASEYRINRIPYIWRFPAACCRELQLVALVSLFLLTSCASTVQRPSKPFRYQTPNEVERNIRSYITHWKGTPHRLGGTRRNGVDCSGFVMLAYNKLFDIQLPRSTSEQIKVGRQIPKRNLQAGDIVFFLLPGKKRHVGIYLSRDEFAHVSSSKGVTISNLQDSYWRRTYWTARRILSL